MKPDLAVIEKPICHDLIRQLEETLIQAKSGEVTGCVCVKSYSDNLTSHMWAGVGKNRKRIVGELFCAATDIANQINLP